MKALLPQLEGGKPRSKKQNRHQLLVARVHADLQTLREDLVADLLMSVALSDLRDLAAELGKAGEAVQGLLATVLPVSEPVEEPAAQ